MLVKTFLFTLIFLTGTALQAQNFDIALIPDSLKKDANVVTRLDEKVFEIKSPGKAIEHERHVFTILNEAGDAKGTYSSSYDKFTNINYIYCTLYDEKGKEIKHVKLKDMQDFSGTGDESLMTDTRYKTNNFNCRSYPYTVSYEEEDEITGMLSIDRWMPQSTDHFSVQNSSFTVIAPKAYALRYKQMNGSTAPSINEKDNKKTYTWEAKNLMAKTEEALSPSWEEILPYEIIEVSDFEAEGYKGNMDTWEGYGRFIYDLQKGRDILPDNLKILVHNLTDNLSSDKEKIYSLYAYLQNNTRYISVQLGIGGLQCFDANYVSTKKYGDCKALSNFMVALLKEVNIKSNSVSIYAGDFEERIVKDFPSHQFNHRIVCVPLLKDTVWLECTDQTLPAGYLSGFTSNRYGLLINENGSALVHTPKYEMAENLQIRKINATINDEGHLTASINTQYRALKQDNIHGYINAVSKEKVMEHLKKALELPTYDVTSFKYTEDRLVLPSVFETLDITANSYAQVSGKRIFIIPNVMTRNHNKLRSEEERKYPIQINYAYKDIDTVEISVPAGYGIEAMPAANNITSKFGKYTTSVKVVGDKIIYYRNKENYSDIFPATDCKELSKFYETIYKADRAKVVLVKKE